MKKSAGSDRILIIVAARTETSILIVIRDSTSCLMISKISELTETHTRNTAIAYTSRILPDGMTVLKIILFNFGRNRPSSATISALSAAIT